MMRTFFRPCQFMFCTYVLVCFSFFCSESFAEGSGASSGSSGSFGAAAWQQRAQKRDVKRWTLQEWLDQKEKNKWMDMWLVWNTPSPYEFSLSASYNNETQTSQAKDSSLSTATATELTTRFYEGSFQAFAGFVGVDIEHFNNFEAGHQELSGLLLFRLFGSGLQSSHLLIGGGQTSIWDRQGLFRQLRGRAEIELYLTKFFGLHGNYDILSKEVDVLRGEIQGHRSAYGIFIDFSGLRVYLQATQSVQTQSLDPNFVGTGSNPGLSIDRQGVQSGLTLFY